MAKKKTIDENAVKHVAKLSRINLSKEEVNAYERQLAGILDYIDKLNELDTRDTPPTSHPLESLKNVFRKDMVRESLSAEGALKNAPAIKDNFFKVPKIIE